jgi:hypothetical protein
MTYDRRTIPPLYAGTGPTGSVSYGSFSGVFRVAPALWLAAPTYSSRKTLAGSILAIFSVGKIVAADTINASAITTADNVEVS